MSWLRSRQLMPALTLLAFLLRVYRLDAQSYWIDEGWTLFFARVSLPELWQWLRTEELHPPLYFPLMNTWVRLVNATEFSTRFVSLLFSVLAVPLTYRLGKALGDVRVGLIAALLMALNPYQIWHAQDARNYSMLAAASTMSMWSFVALWQQGGRRWWILYIFSTLWAVNSHYHGLAIIGVQGLFLLITARRHWRGYPAWAGSLLLILLPTILWISVGPKLWKSAHWLPQVDLLTSYLRNAVAFAVGELTPRPQAIPLMLLFFLFYLLGLIYAARRPWGKWQGWEMVAFLLSYTLATNIAVWIYGQLNTSVYLERYLIPLQTGYLITVAMGILAVATSVSALGKRRTWARWAGIAAAGGVTLALAGISIWVLNNHYNNSVYAKPDWRGVAQHIENFGQPGDAIIMTGDGGEKLLDYYYHGSLPLYFDEFDTPVPAPDEAAQLVAGIAQNHARIWFTPYGVDIDPVLEGWLAENSHPAWHSWIGRKRLALYSTQADLDRVETLNAHFPNQAGQGPQLATVALPAQPTAAGDLLPLTLTWQTGAPLPEEVQLSLRLTNNFGDVFTQSDWPPLPGSTTTWPANQPITDRRSLRIPADVPPGSYLLQLVVYNPASGQSQGLPATISNIQIAAAEIAPPPEALAIPNFTVRNSQSTVQLVGHAAPDTIQPGQEMWLWLYGLAAGPVSPKTTLQITLAGNGDPLAANLQLSEVFGPLNGWQPGQVRRGVVHLPTSPRLQGSAAQLAASLPEPGQPIAEIPLGNINLQTRARQFEPPAIDTSLNVTFGNPPAVTLLGFNRNSQIPASAIDLILHWRAETEMDTNYTVFVQLLNPAGEVVAQIDRQPQAGAAPTTTWLPGEFLADPHTIPLPPNLPPGEYRLIAGLYNAATGARLPVSGGGDFVDLEQITVQ